MKGPPAPGSVVENCSRCSEQVWIAPTSWQAIPAGFLIHLVCIECAAQQVATSDEKVVDHALTEDQREEIALATGALDHEIDEVAEAFKLRFWRDRYAANS